MEAIARLMRALERFPGIGPRTAERMAYFLLREPSERALELAEAIRVLKETLRPCRDCFHTAAAERCAICCDPARDPYSICVVESSRDLNTIEQSIGPAAGGAFRGRYHVLMGAVAPADGVHDDHLTLEALRERIQSLAAAEGGRSVEIVLATNPTLSGDATALACQGRLAGAPARISRLARGLPTGAALEFLGPHNLKDAFQHRQAVSP